MNRREETNRDRKEQSRSSETDKDKSSKYLSSPNDENTYDVTADRKDSNKIAAGEISRCRDHVARVSSTRSSDVSARGGVDESLPAIANYKNKRLFKGLRPGQSEIMKEIAKTTDVRKDLFNLQKRKIDILATLEKNLNGSKPKSIRRPAEHNEKELGKCSAYYKNLTQSTAAFLPVDDGKRHYRYDKIPHSASARFRGLGSARSNSSRPAGLPVKSTYRSPYLEDVKAQKTTVRTHRVDSRHKATLRKAPEVLSFRENPRSPLADHRHSSNYKKLIAEEHPDDISDSWSVTRGKIHPRYANEVPVEQRNVPVNVNVPLMTSQGSRRTTPSSASSRWPLISNGQALEANMDVLDMGDAGDREWCTLDSEERQLEMVENKAKEKERLEDGENIVQKMKHMENNKQRKNAQEIETLNSASPTKIVERAKLDFGRNGTSRVLVNNEIRGTVVVSHRHLVTR